MFDCDSQHPAPPYDPNKENTVCGSDDYNYAIYLFAAVLVVIAAILVRAVRAATFAVKNIDPEMAHSSAVSRMEVSLQTHVAEILKIWFIKMQISCSSWFCIWTNANDGIAEAQREDCSVARSVTLTDLICGSLRRLAVTQSRTHREESLPVDFLNFVTILTHSLISFAALTAFVLVACFMLYPSLKLLSTSQAFTTYTYQYSWLVSSAFLTEVPSAVTVLIIWCVGLGYMAIRSSEQHDLRVRQAQLLEALTGAAARQATTPSTDRTSFRLVAAVKERVGDGLIAALLLAVVVLANVAYLYVALSSHYNTNLQTFAQVALGAFK